MAAKAKAGQVQIISALSGFTTLIAARLPYKYLGVGFIICFVVFLNLWRPKHLTPPNFTPPFQYLAAPISIVTEISAGSSFLRALEAQNEKIITTEAGRLEYQRKMTVWATSYDSSCAGCNERTALGLRAGYGVVAVDPRIIPLGSKVYIPGYGIAVAGDTGGAILGNKIDLGFDDVRNGWWRSRFVEVYILK